MGTGSSRSDGRAGNNSAATTTIQPTTQSHKPKTSKHPKTHFTPEDLFGVLQEEVKLVIENLLKKEITEQMEEKLKNLKIRADQRDSIHKRILSDVRKQIPILLDKVIEEQLKLAEKEKIPDGETRVTGNIERTIEGDIKEMVQHSLERAIADEVIQKVKHEKISTITPTFQPTFREQRGSGKLGIFGIRHLQVFIILLFLAISFIQRVDLSVALVAISDSKHANPNFEEFKWDESVKGLLLSSFFWGYIFVQLPGSVLTEKYGPKIVLSVSMVACSTMSLLMPIAIFQGGWIGLYMLKVLQGISQGAFIPGVYVFTSRWIPPKEKAKLFTPAFGGMQLGTVIGLPIFGFLCASPLGWPATFLFSAIVGYLWVVLWIFAAANSPSVHRSISREEQLYIEGSFGFGEITVKGTKKTIPWKSIFLSRPFIAIVIGHFGENWAYFTLLNGMPTFLNHVLNIDITNNALLSASTYFFGWILIVILGFVASFIREKNLYSVGFERKLWTSIALYGNAVSFAVLGLTQTNDFFLVMSLLTSIIVMNSTIYNGLFSNHADLSPNYVGVLMGLSNTIGNISSVLAPLFVGIVVTDPADIRQWGKVFNFVAVLCFVCNTIYLLFGSSEIQSWNTPSNLHLQLEKASANLSTDDGTFGSRKARLMVLGLNDGRKYSHQHRRNSL